ncbi:MAG: carboxyl transferase domain-containing protein [Acutalibacteraceae bacterium]
MSIVDKQQQLSEAAAFISETSAYKNLQMFFDDGAFNEIDAFAKSGDSYAEVVAGYGTANGYPVFAFAQNSDILGGAMSKAQAAKLKKLYDLAVKTGTPVVGFYDSKGARLTQGDEMLAAYGAVLNSVSNLSGVVPQISVVLGTCLGVGALNAVSADFVIMTEKAQLSLETNGEGGTAEQALEGGYANIIAKDSTQAIEKAKTLLSYLPSNNLSMTPFAETAQAADITSSDVVKSVFDEESFFEISGSDAAVTGFARLDGGVVGTVITKGEKISCKASAEIAKLVRFCDAFAVPVVTFADSKGFECICGAKKVTNAYAEATTVKATVITGEAYGAFYVAVAGTGANADITMAYADASISPLAPITGATVLWSDKMNVPVADQPKVVEEFKATQCSAFNAAANGYVEDIINPADTREKLISALDMLSGKRVTNLPKKHSTIY